MMSKTLGIVFSNMHDSMLGQLTENRTMASVPLCSHSKTEAT